METRDSIRNLLEDLSEKLQTSKEETVLSALKLLYTTTEKPTPSSVPQPGEILSKAHLLYEENGPFTMDELVDFIYQDEVLLNCHAAKIYFGQILPIGGFHRTQVRRAKDWRPNVWLPE